MCKNIIINKYKYLYIIKAQNNYWIRIKDLKLYIIEFEENNIIKPKIYLFNYIVKTNNCLSIIVITIYNKYIFSTNNNICKA